MGIKSLIQMAVTLAILDVATVKLPHILKEVRKAQLVLLKDSKASMWGQAYLPRASLYINTQLLSVTQKSYLLPR